ncbi:beta-ketoacyl-[acyl-carrier-protein] synthase family protein [Streptomyces aureocirculatus]|uniref:hypothetical protein n=1 Tax=Streptomyces aureocirculatus TaxID=67275 RepID=UPI0004C69308|nr:hypothetical protein [Streptomyces aureocirculatus]
MAYISRPEISTPTHEITGEEIAKLHTSAGGEPAPDATPGARGPGPFARTLTELERSASAEERDARAFADIATLSETAARRALRAAGIGGSQVGAIITFHDTGRRLGVAGDPAVSLDLHLIARLGLPPTVARWPLNPMGDSGGVHALNLAHAVARPGSPVLVVGAEAHSSLLTHSQLPLWQKLRLADGGAAVLVSATPVGDAPVVHITDEWSYAFTSGWLPPTTARFPSLAAETAAVTEALAELPWVGDDAWTPDVALIHPSGSPAPAGPAELRQTAGTRVQPGGGDIGGVTTLRGLSALFDEPAPAGSALLLGVGTDQASACRIEWRNQ